LSSAASFVTGKQSTTLLALSFTRHSAATAGGAGKLIFRLIVTIARLSFCGQLGALACLHEEVTIILSDWI